LRISRSPYVVKKLSGVEAGTLMTVSVGIFLYAILLLIEGGGLLLRQTWADISRSHDRRFHPVEIYKVLRRVTFMRAGVMVLNVVIVVYLVARLRRERRAHRALPRQR
jgi:uncharacterized membrane protein (DUF2068 family)